MSPTPEHFPDQPLDWKQSVLWLLLAVACFHAAYTSVQFPSAGLLIFGYALALVQLPRQASVRRAFYWGLATGFFCYAPQLYFFWRIFSVAAVVLWLILAFWIGLFTAMICGITRRWGRRQALWLTPCVWTGIEYFRSELYYLKFAWLNVGCVFPNHYQLMPLLGYGVYGVGFLVFALAATCSIWKEIQRAARVWILIMPISIVAGAMFLEFMVAARPERPDQPLSIVGVQMEFPPANVIPKALDKALKAYPTAPIFVLSEYTLDGPVTEPLKRWCRDHARYLIVGGKDPAGPDNFYDTAFVVGTNGDIVFKQVKSVPIQFFRDGLPAPEQKVWDSPWGKIGICVCYDLSYTRVTDELVRQGAQLLIVPTMDVEEWGRHQHELHSRIAPVRAAEYGIPIFRVASSGISQAVNSYGIVVAQTAMPGNGAILAANLRLPMGGGLPIDRYLAPLCVILTGVVTMLLLILTWREGKLTFIKTHVD